MVVFHQDGGLSSRRSAQMSARSVTTGISKPPEPREGAGEHHGVEMKEQRPRNIPANTYPTDGFSLEVDAKIKSQHPTLEAAMKIGAELKRKFPMIQVTIHDAAAKTRTLGEADK
jgi:hypothetical protein